MKILSALLLLALAFVALDACAAAAQGGPAPSAVTAAMNGYR